MLYDMHCHLDFAENAERAVCAAARDIAAFSATATPAGYAEACCRFSGFSQVRIALGLHPWYVAEQGEEGVRAFEEQAPSCAFVGEVGLDFSSKRIATRAAQEAAFKRVVRSCMRSGDRVRGGFVSLHAVSSANEVLDALDQVGALGERGSLACLGGRAVVFHSFSGTSDELTRAIRAGLCFSVGPRMLNTKRGRAYVRAIPAERLLLETDLPSREGGSLSCGEWHAALRESLDIVVRARFGNRGESDEAAEFVARLEKTSARLLGM